MTDSTIENFRRIVDVQANALSSEEDVKIKVVLPLLRALGYEDSDFNFEGRTGHGYVDVVVDRFRTGIVVETKSPKKRLDEYVEQLESYVFHKHRHDRDATVAILTDGDVFRVYGLTDAFRKGSLATHQIDSFRRAELAAPEQVIRLSELLSKQSNQSHTIPGVITRLQHERAAIRERIRATEAEIATLTAERTGIDSQLRDLHAELNRLSPKESASAAGVRGSLSSSRTAEGEATYKYRACREILKLLKERGATSRDRALTSKWLKQQLVGSEGIRTDQAVDFGLIELRDTHDKISQEKGRDWWVWLK